MIFTDPPYNVPIAGNVSGLGKHKHREFIEASGEMSREAFVQFLERTLGAASSRLCDGGIAYVCMDWRHMGELLEAGTKVIGPLKNLCVWNKTNAGMGTFYRSKHELVFAFKKGTQPHVNNFELGQHGRHRTNVWDYAGATALSSTRDDDLAMHPTVKPVAMIADAIMDVSHRGDVVLDNFSGSGSTLIAAHETGRIARLVALDSAYCDVIIERWQKLSGQNPVLAGTGQNFAHVRQARQTNVPLGLGHQAPSG